MSDLPELIDALLGAVERPVYRFFAWVYGWPRQMFLPNITHAMKISTYRWRVLLNVKPGQPGYWNNPLTRWVEERPTADRPTNEEVNA